jgi:uncharacterized UPF0146 family protein
MDGHKHIETCIGNYIASHYTRAIEIGIGRNVVAAKIVSSNGALIRCTDVKALGISGDLHFSQDDIFSPDNSLYNGAEVIYSIRPAVEMIPPLIELAGRINADLIVYHLGFETYEHGGEIINCGVLLHKYHGHQNPSNRVD